MSNPNIGFVKLHRSGIGRLGVVVNVLFILLYFAYFGFIQLKLHIEFVRITNTTLGQRVLPEYNSLYYLLPLLVFALVQKILLLFIASQNSKRLLAAPDSTDEHTTALKQLQLQWLFWNNGQGCHPWNRVELGLPRTVADSSLKKQLNEIELPESLIEPEAVKSSKPGNLFACVASLLFLLILVCSYFIVPVTSIRIVVWIFMPLALFSIVINFLALPAVHQSRKLPSYVRYFARSEVLEKSMIVGPGWVKFGKRIWRADRDLLMIRCKGVRRSSSVIDCMLAGSQGRRRMRFSGVGDEDFQLLFGGWNIEYVRMELVVSDLG